MLDDKMKGEGNNEGKGKDAKEGARVMAARGATWFTTEKVIESLFGNGGGDGSGGVFKVESESVGLLEEDDGEDEKEDEEGNEEPASEEKSNEECSGCH
ncbi:uncharacterized protein FIBRA_09564 [Fibroporia radiculosa]|uniref:Uncharacterized protein n=1 Tax=Fibroporia radiculosa TaxID=599839 RepID=J7S6N3_9APHY|nr:uncharacterized protein FIBRA_09564 [Fibroporia radiculosa]CCM07219.1 predicted protein [Fibroporia radiculosa]